MAKEIKLPKLSEDADEGTVAEVMIQKGDTIEKDDSVIAVESDKATVEVPAEEAGTVKEVKVSEGDAIKTGDVIAVLEDEDESDEDKEEMSEQDEESEEQDDSIEEDQQEEQETEKEDEEQKSEKEKGSEKQSEEDEQKGDKGEEVEEEETQETGGEEEKDEDKKKKSAEDKDQESDESEEENEESEQGKESPESEGIHAAPGAKRLARQHDVSLEGIEGNGPDGLITANDVKKAAGVNTEGETTSGVELPDFSKWGSVEQQPLSQIRKAMAKQTQSSWQAIPHVTQFDEADVSGIEEYIGQHRAEVEEQGGKLTITTVLTKVIASALHQFPKFNASIDMDAGEVILKKYVHIGIAVDTDEGLLVLVVRDVDEKSIVKLATEITELAQKARNGKLSSEEIEGGNIIISNLGVIGGTQFTPVIYHPQVAILGVSEMKITPVYNKETESFQPILTLPLSLSYDHRLIDGAEGARFLRYVCNALEDPYKALLGE